MGAVLVWVVIAVAVVSTVWFVGIALVGVLAEAHGALGWIGRKLERLTRMS